MFCPNVSGVERRSKHRSRSTLIENASGGCTKRLPHKTELKRAKLEQLAEDHAVRLVTALVLLEMVR